MEYGEGAARVGCETAWDGRVQYCVCDADKCNEGSLQRTTFTIHLEQFK